MGAFRRRWPGLSYGRGEDWHYVGEAGEPAFENSWANLSGWAATAFRARELGVVDVHVGVTGGSGPAVFTLPAGYRPTVSTVVAGLTVLYADLSPVTDVNGGSVTVEPDGTVSLTAVETVVAAGVVGFFFLDPPTVTP